MIERQRDEILQRIERLEKENRRMEGRVRRWKSGTVTAGLAAIAIVFVAATAANNIANVIEAERLIIKDADGKTRMEIGYGLENGSVDGLQVRDKDGKLRAGIGVITEGPLQGASGIAVWDQKEGVVAQMGSNAEGGATLALFDTDRPGSLTRPTNQPRAAIGFGMEGGTIDGLQVRDDKGKLRAGIGVVAEGPLQGASGMAAFDEKEGLIVSMGSGAQGTASLSVYHPDRPGSLARAADPPQAVIGFGSGPVDGLQLRDDNGKLRLGLGVITAEGMLQGSAGLAVADQSEGVVMSLGSSPNGQTLVTLFDPDKAVSLESGLTGAPGTVISSGQVMVLNGEGQRLLERAYQALSGQGGSGR